MKTTTSFRRDKKENMQWGRVWKDGGGAEDLRKEVGGIWSKYVLWNFQRLNKNDSLNVHIMRSTEKHKCTYICIWPSGCLLAPWNFHLGWKPCLSTLPIKFNMILWLHKHQHGKLLFCFWPCSTFRHCLTPLCPPLHPTTSQTGVALFRLQQRKRTE